MTNDFQTHINQITKKAKIKYLDISNRDLVGEANLSEFTVLTSLNSYNNSFESLEFLNSLPNKELPFWWPNPVVTSNSTPLEDLS